MLDLIANELLRQSQLLAAAADRLPGNLRKQTISVNSVQQLYVKTDSDFRRPTQPGNFVLAAVATRR